jgi:hypothetical protein
MGWRTYFLSIVSVLAVVCLSCRGPETGGLSATVAGESNESHSTRGPLDAETPRPESEARTPEWNHGREPSVDKAQYEKELILLDGLAASLL